MAKVSHMVSTAIAATLAFAPVQSSAGAGDAVAGALVGAFIGGAIVDQAHRNRNRRTTTRAPVKRTPTISASQREANREVQSALNHFGYNVGTADGVIGPRSRTGISAFQTLVGYPATGQLTEFERTILVTAYQRARAGGPTITQAVANHPQGTRGLLLLQRDEMLGLPTANQGVTTAATPSAPASTPAIESVPVVTPPTGPALPNLFGGTVITASLASHCNKVSLMTNTNGGFVTAASMTDANTALAEQFCLARTYAMAQSEDLMTKMPGTNAQQVGEQCATLGPALADQVAALSLQDRGSVLKSVSDFALTSGMPPAQLAATARVCLGAGYTTDDMGVAIGSALLLTALGEHGYAELLGHHLSQGFGASTRRDLALPWYELGLEAVDKGATTVFAPGMPDRPALLRKAVHTLGGTGDQAAVTSTPVPAALPSFAAPVAPPAAVAPIAPPATAAPAAQPAPKVAAVTAAANNAAADDDIVTRTGVDALPLAARLPFMMLRN